ncbi:MAG: precorrin-2 C(20)-methyltransferase [Candidatus Omnitrophica bacterium]|nr:precorrin-2 C(20)-methyltransferase [Candidatus Omnitrophota bacterium]
MRNDHNKITGTPPHQKFWCGGKLYGIGIGPGDPKLLTVKAREILDTVDTIFVPKAKDDGRSHARSIIEKAVSRSKNFIELTFPMTKDQKKLESYWLRAAQSIVKELKRERTAAFVTIGDPFIYSTYIYLLETLRKYFPGIEVETVPGISAFNAAAASACLPLLKGDEKLAILPVTRTLAGLKDALKEFDTVVLMKVGSKINSVIRLLKEMKLVKNAILVSHAGRSDERIIRDLASLKDKKLGYLSVIIVRRRMGNNI